MIHTLNEQIHSTCKRLVRKLFIAYVANKKNYVSYKTFCILYLSYCYEATVFIFLISESSDILLKIILIYFRNIRFVTFRKSENLRDILKIKFQNHFFAITCKLNIESMKYIFWIF